MVMMMCYYYQNIFLSTNKAVDSNVFGRKIINGMAIFHSYVADWQVDYMEELLLVATRGSAVLGAATLAAVCDGSGFEVRQLGSAGGGGKALVERMLHLSQTAGAKFMATMPLDTGAATFWARAGFSALLLLGSKSSW